MSLVVGCWDRAGWFRPLPVVNMLLRLWAILSVCVAAISGDVLSRLEAIDRRLDMLPRRASVNGQHRRHRTISRRRYGLPEHTWRRAGGGTRSGEQHRPLSYNQFQNHKRDEVQKMWELLVEEMQLDAPRQSSWKDRMEHSLSKTGADELQSEENDMTFLSTQPLSESTLMERAGAHVRQMYLEHGCSTPTGLLLHVADLLPDTGLLYYPSQVLLGRCRTTSGCCPVQHERCSPRRTRSVHRAFLVKSKMAGSGGGTELKEFSFLEDTECHCSEKPANDDLCTSKPPPADDTDRNLHENWSAGGRSDSSYRSHNTRCQCPGEFISRQYVDGGCRCDCYDGSSLCVRIKRGRVHLSERDNRCILRGSCAPPDCTYGTYRTHHARCPRRHE